MGALEGLPLQRTSALPQTNLKTVFILLIAVDLVIIAGASLWLGAPDSSGCACPLGWLSIAHVSLGHEGEATFSLNNYGTFDYTIIQAAVAAQEIHGSTTVSLFSNNVISFKSSLNITVTFSNIVWVDGAHYEFILTDSLGDHFTSNVIA